MNRTYVPTERLDSHSQKSANNSPAGELAYIPHSDRQERRKTAPHHSTPSPCRTLTCQPASRAFVSQVDSSGHRFLFPVRLRRKHSLRISGAGYLSFLGAATSLAKRSAPWTDRRLLDSSTCIYRGKTPESYRQFQHLASVSLEVVCSAS